MFSTAFTLITLVLTVAAAHQSRPRMVHQGLARRSQGDVQLFKRYSSTRWSFYDVGLGACGQTNVASDFIVALNAQQFGPGYPGAHCFKTITLTYNGKSAKATIMDMCPGCPYGGLDLSRGLFKFFASEDVGIITGDWVFGDSTGAAPATTTTQKAVAAVIPTTTTKSTPTTTWTPKAVTTTKATPTTTWTPKATPTTTWTPKANLTTTSTRKAATTTWTPEAVVQAAVTTSPTSSNVSTSKSTPATTSSASSKVNYSSSIAAARSSSASLASSFSSTILPSASASAGASVNVTAQIEDNLQAIGILLTNLGKLVMAAGLGQDKQD